MQHHCEGKCVAEITTGTLNFMFVSGAIQSQLFHQVWEINCFLD